jgi:hypothetical protein
VRRAARACFASLIPRSPGNFHGFGSWFDVDFKGPGCTTVTLSTSPDHKCAPPAAAALRAHFSDTPVSRLSCAGSPTGST